jgi:hypothetical protein
MSDRIGQPHGPPLHKGAHSIWLYLNFDFFALLIAICFSLGRLSRKVPVLPLQFAKALDVISEINIPYLSLWHIEISVIPAR